MKTIYLNISDDTSASEIISELNKRLPDSIRNSPEFYPLYEQVTNCIESLTERVKRIAQTGTTIQIERKFAIDDFKIIIVLDYPKKKGLFGKLKSMFN